ncbi:MAG: hypothetical protein J5631_10330 [Spirochaetaceae bacterium]|nr:hypothetical protein [Spirochaetaceae bacterium]
MGGTSIEESNATLLLGQSAALSYQKVDIDLIVNGEHFAINNVTATTTTDVLPKIPIGASVSGTATIYLADGTTRVAQLEMTEIGLHNNLVFKVPYNYTCYNLTGSQVASGTYLSRDGIDLSSVTTDSMSGWQCINDGTIHNGSYVTGVRGDIQLYALPVAGAAILTAIPDKTELVAGTSTASDYTATITITNAASIPLITTNSSLIYNDPPMLDNSDPTKYTVDLHLAGGSNAAMFDDDTTVTATIAVGSDSRDVTFTLKNKYTVEIEDTAGNAVVLGTFLQGSSLTFTAAASAASSMIPNGREAVAFKYGSSLVLYKNASAGATSVNISSSSFTGLTSRTIYLEPVLDFTISGVTGGDTFVAGQDGTAAHPYLLRYSGADTQLSMITFTISDSTGTITPSPSPNIGVRAETSYIAIDNSRFTPGSIPAEGVPFTVTYTDNGTGATKVINVKVVKPPVIPDFTIQITPPTSHVGTKGDPSNGKYALVNLSDTFEFTPIPAVGTSFPDGTTFLWTVLVGSASPQTLTPNTAVGESCSKSPADLGLTDAVIGRSLTTATSISVSCTAINSDPSVSSKSATSLPSDTVYAFLLYTIPSFTIDIMAPGGGINSSNSKPDENPPVYAIKDRTFAFTFTANPGAASFPPNTTFSWTIQAEEVQTTPLTPEYTDVTTASVTPMGLGFDDSNMGTKKSDAKTVTIGCTASNANAVANVDATDATMKLFRLTIPEYKITIIPPDGISTKTVGDNTIYLLTEDEFDNANKKFKLKVEPKNPGDSFPIGTALGWTLRAAETPVGDTLEVTAKPICGTASVPTGGTTAYPVTCTATLSGAVVPTIDHPARANVYVDKIDVETVAIGNLSQWLTDHGTNTVDNPYRLNVTGITDSTTLGTLKSILNTHSDKYVDLSRTTLSGITSLYTSFQWNNHLTAAPSIPEGVTSLKMCFDMGTYGTALAGPSTIVIPSTVTDMFKCFMACTELKNVNIIVKANLTNGNAWKKTFIHITASQNITVYVLNDAVKDAILSPTHQDGGWYNNTTNAGVNIVVGLPPGF